MPAKIVNFPKHEESKPMAAIYHRVYAHESYEAACKSICRLIKTAIETQPGKPRHLFLDIDGHRNRAGGFDDDMFKLQTQFIIKEIMPYITRVFMPLGQYRNGKRQRNNFPNEN